MASVKVSDDIIDDVMSTNNGGYASPPFWEHFSCSHINIYDIDLHQLEEPLASELRGFRDRSLDIHTRYKHQTTLKKLIVHQLSSCENNNPNIFNTETTVKMLFDINLLNKQLSDHTSTMQLDDVLHHTIQCLIETYLKPTTYDARYKYTSNLYRIKKLLSNMTMVGGESAYGYAFRSDMFVVKTPRVVQENSYPRDDNGEDIDNEMNNETETNADVLIHEAFIGLAALNSLKSVIPNFMYVYGYFSCSPIYLQHTSARPLNWCNSHKNESSYIICEYVNNSGSFGEMLPKMTDVHVVSIFYQILNALRVAYGKFKYTHFDLHSGNILIRRYDIPVAIPLYDNASKIYSYIVSNYVAYIIDYGFSQIEIQSTVFRDGDSPINALYNNFPLYDIYKLIGFLGLDVLKDIKRHKHHAQVKIYNILDNMFSYFKEGTLSDRVKKYYMAYNNNEQDFFDVDKKFYKQGIKYWDYISWLHQQPFIATYKYLFNVPSMINKIRPMADDITSSSMSGHYLSSTLSTVSGHHLSSDIYVYPNKNNNNICTYNKAFLNKNIINSNEYCETLLSLWNSVTLSATEKNNAKRWLNEHFDIKHATNTSLNNIRRNIERILTKIMSISGDVVEGAIVSNRNVNMVLRKNIIPITKKNIEPNIKLLIARMKILLIFNEVIIYTQIELESLYCVYRSHNKNHHMLDNVRDVVVKIKSYYNRQLDIIDKMMDKITEKSKLYNDFNKLYALLRSNISQ